MNILFLSSGKNNIVADTNENASKQVAHDLKNHKESEILSKDLWHEISLLKQLTTELISSFESNQDFAWIDYFIDIVRNEHNKVHTLIENYQKVNLPKESKKLKEQVKISQNNIVNATSYSKFKEKNTALYHAAISGHTKIVELLLKNGADVNAKNNHRKTALHGASGFWIDDYVETVQVLISYGADINIKDQGGMTPLHYAALLGHPEVIKILIQHGADLESRDYSNKETPCDKAKKFSRVQNQKIELLCNN